MDRKLLHIALRDEIDVEGTIYNAYLPNGVFTGQITDMSGSSSAGFIPSDFNEDISYWNVSSVTNMERMFNSAIIFNQNISNWDTSSVISCENYDVGTLEWNELFKPESQTIC